MNTLNNLNEIKNLVKKILTTDSDIRILYDRQILFDMDVDNIIETSEFEELNFDDIDFNFISFFKVQEIETPTDIRDYIKLIDKIKKSDIDKSKPEYMFNGSSVDIVLLTEEILNNFYETEFISANIDYLQIYKVQYLKPEKIKL